MIINHEHGRMTSKKDEMVDVGVSGASGNSNGNGNGNK